MLLRSLLALLLLLGLMGATARGSVRGSVRVVTIAVVDGQVVGFRHGCGFAVAPNRIVTNAHVVELAERVGRRAIVSGAWDCL